MFHVGDQVVYGIHGVCNIIDQEKRTVDKKQVTYLVLEPVGQSSCRYFIPTHNATAMGKLRTMLSAKELETLLSSCEVLKDGWIKDENVRKQTYRELIGSGDRVRLMQMMHALYRQKDNQTKLGKKIHMCDDNFLRDAEKLLASEISIVLNMEQEQAKQYIREKLNEDA